MVKFNLKVGLVFFPTFHLMRSSLFWKDKAESEKERNFLDNYNYKQINIYEKITLRSSYEK